MRARAALARAAVVASAAGARMTATAVMSIVPRRHRPDKQVVGRMLHGDLEAGQLLDAFQRLDVLLAGQADGLARRAGARGAPDAVHVVLRILREVVID